ncbi:MAG: hypothetical protein HY755_00075 [Nitrospirae bacterium]|nr:hypothetical protein [Nitrospirota bacterium]
MAKKYDEVSLKLSALSEFNTAVTIGGKTYHVQTEHGSQKNPQLTTLIYYKGEIVFSAKTDYSDIMHTKDFDSKLKDMLKKQHKNSITNFTRRIEEAKKKTEYFDAVKKLLQRGNSKQALKILKDALEEFPEDPFIMSYYGCLTAIVEKKYDEGINICQTALEKLSPDISPDEKPLYTTFYLNLGRAYLAGGERKLAIESFQNGLNIDKENHDLLWEIKKLGTRKKTPIPFLSRNNPLNKYLGIFLSQLKRK